jgi:hypothetical protein
MHPTANKIGYTEGVPIEHDCGILTASGISAHGLEPLAREGMVNQNQRKVTARHECFFALSLLETVVGSREAAARGGLF